MWKTILDEGIEKEGQGERVLADENDMYFQGIPAITALT
jgi:hypothetical protein